MKKKLAAGFAAGVLFVMAGVTNATLITQSDMKPSAIIEDFEGLYGQPGLTPWFGGWSVLTTPFDFGNGMVMTLPNPNTTYGAIIGDWSVGDATFTLGALNGSIDSASDLTSGTAYMAMYNADISFEFTFDSGINQFGFAYNNSGWETNYTYINAYDFDGNLIETVYGSGATTSRISEWLGLETLTSIHTITVTGYYNVIDDITFTNVAPVPEPATMLLFGTGLAGLAGTRLRRKKK